MEHQTGDNRRDWRGGLRKRRGPEVIVSDRESVLNKTGISNDTNIVKKKGIQ